MVLSYLHVIDIKIKIVSTFFSYRVFKLQCAFYTYSASQFRRDIFQVFMHHTWLVAIRLDSRACPMELRKSVKRINFGIIFGSMTSHRFCLILRKVNLSLRL